jgi:hypothetical protein
MNVKPWYPAGVVLLCGCLSFAIAPPAHADWYEWSFESTDGSVTGGGTVIGDGTLTTVAVDDGFEVKGIFGTWDGFGITGLKPANTYFSNDNMYFYAEGTFLDDKGVAFSLSNGTSVNISYNNGLYTAVVDGIAISGIFKDTILVEVPGPVVGAGLPGLVFAGGFLLAWRRKRKDGAALAAT